MGIILYKCTLMFPSNTALSVIYLLLFTVQQILRWKYGQTTLGYKMVRNKYPLNILNMLYNNNFKSMSGRFFCFLLILSLGLFHIEKIISKVWTSISWSKDRWRSYICIPSGAQTHIIAHTKGEPRARLSNPFLCRKKNYFKNYQKLLNLWLD